MAVQYALPIGTRRLAIVLIAHGNPPRYNPPMEVTHEHRNRTDDIPILPGALGGCARTALRFIHGGSGNHYRRGLLAGWLILAMAGCEASLTRPSEVPEWILAEWHIAQDRLSSLTGDARVYDISPEQFRFREKEATFDCGGQLAVGCFTHGFGRAPTISYWTEKPTVIRHEAGHAILWKLGYECFPRYEHEEWPYGC